MPPTVIFPPPGPGMPPTVILPAAGATTAVAVPTAVAVATVAVVVVIAAIIVTPFALDAWKSLEAAELSEQQARLSELRLEVFRKRKTMEGCLSEDQKLKLIALEELHSDSIASNKKVPEERQKEIDRLREALFCKVEVLRGKDGTPVNTCSGCGQPRDNNPSLGCPHCGISPCPTCGQPRDIRSARCPHCGTN